MLRAYNYHSGRKVSSKVGENWNCGLHFWLPKKTFKFQTVVLSLAGLFWKVLSDEQEQGTQQWSVTAVSIPLPCRQPSFSRTAEFYGHTPPGTAAPLKDTRMQSMTLGELLSGHRGDIGVMATGQPAHKQLFPVHETRAPNKRDVMASSCSSGCQLVTQGNYNLQALQTRRAVCLGQSPGKWTQHSKLRRTRHAACMVNEWSTLC